MCSECSATGWAAVLSNIEVTSCHSAVEPASIGKVLKTLADAAMVVSSLRQRGVLWTSLRTQGILCMARRPAVLSRLFVRPKIDIELTHHTVLLSCCTQIGNVQAVAQFLSNFTKSLSGTIGDLLSPARMVRTSCDCLSCLQTSPCDRWTRPLRYRALLHVSLLCCTHQ